MKNQQFVMILFVTTRGGWGGQKSNLQDVMKYAHFFFLKSPLTGQDTTAIYVLRATVLNNGDNEMG